MRNQKYSTQYKWKDKNPEKVRDIARKWRKANSDKMKEYGRRYRLKHGEERKRRNAQREKVRRKKFRDIISQQAKARYAANPRGFADKKRKYKYGLSPERFQEKLSSQKGCCAVCGCFMEKPFVDHNHATKEVRDLLCGRCNVALGMVFENVVILQNMIAYIIRHRKVEDASSRCSEAA